MRAFWNDGRTSTVPPCILAICALSLDDLDGAFRHCEEALEERDVQFAVWHLWFPELKAVRADPRFTAVRARFNARRQAY